MSNAQELLQRLLSNPTAKIEARGVAKTSTRSGVYISVQVGLTASTFFVGVDPTGVAGHVLFVERVG